MALARSARFGRLRQRWRELWLLANRAEPPITHAFYTCERQLSRRIVSTLSMVVFR